MSQCFLYEYNFGIFFDALAFVVVVAGAFFYSVAAGGDAAGGLALFR